MSGDDMLSKQDILNELTENINTWKEKYGVKRIGLFGSYNREEQNESSDIDIVVEFNELSFDHYMDLKISLEELFQKPIDLIIVDVIKPTLKPIILKNVTFID